MSSLTACELLHVIVGNSGVLPKNPFVVDVRANFPAAKLNRSFANRVQDFTCVVEVMHFLHTANYLPQPASKQSAATDRF